MYACVDNTAPRCFDAVFLAAVVAGRSALAALPHDPPEWPGSGAVPVPGKAAARQARSWGFVSKCDAKLPAPGSARRAADPTCLRWAAKR